MRKIFKKRNDMDERERMEFYKAEHYGYYVMFYLVFAEVIIESYILHMSFRETIGEIILLFAGSITLIFNAVKHGNWDYHYKPGFKAYLGFSLVSAIPFTIIIMVSNMLRFEAVRENIWGRAVPIAAFIFVSIFILCFIALAITGEMAKNKRKKIEKELEEEDDNIEEEEK